jgi:hypothetical protein
MSISSQPTKAKLIALDGGETIEFMFNPNLLAFSRTISLEQAKGAQTETGQNKVSFKHPNPYSLTINNIILDTYETATSVLTYIEKFKKAVEFSQGGKGDKKRPPIYLFSWHEDYLRCFVKTLSYKLTLFLPDGTPVRASVDLTLEEVDYPVSKPGQSPSNPSTPQRQKDNRKAKK